MPVFHRSGLSCPGRLTILVCHTFLRRHTARLLCQSPGRLYGRVVGLTGIIYGAIVVAWAAYLVPLVLRRHDEAARIRSIDRFSSAMRVLSRRGEALGGRLVVTPPRTVDRLVNPGLDPRTKPVASATPRPSRQAMRAAATRRRRVLIGLLLITAGVGVAWSLGVAPWWSPGIPLAVVVGFLALARRQVRKASETYWSEAAASPAPSNVIRRTSSRVEASHGAAKGPDEEPTVPMDAMALKNAVADEPERIMAISLRTSDGGSLWDPLPITLPTYVDKPAATRTIRTIDLNGADTWSSGHSTEVSEPVTPSASERAAAAHSGAAVAEPAGDTVAEEPARAVNG